MLNRKVFSVSLDSKPQLKLELKFEFSLLQLLDEPLQPLNQFKMKLDLLNNKNDIV